MWLYMGIYITYNLRKYNGGTYFEKPKLISLFKKNILIIKITKMYYNSLNDQTIKHQTV